jgi:transposase-like protein
VTVTDICQRYGISPHTLAKWRERGLVPRPFGWGRGTHYGQIHIEAIEAHLAIKHNNVSIAQAVAYCKEAGITLPEYVKTREQSIRHFGLGVA